MDIFLSALLLIPALCIVFAWRHLFFRNRFTPPSGSSDLHICTLQEFPFLLEKGLPYPVGIRTASRRVILLDGDWDFHSENDPQITRVRVPHCFNTADSALRDFEGSVYYERDFILPARTEGSLVRLAFLGSFYITDVWLNGQPIGSHAGGYLPFYFDISAAAPGSHHIKVRVDNRLSLNSLPQRLFRGHNLGWHPYGGLHRSVLVEICPPQYCFKLRVAPDLQKGTVNVAALFHAPNNSIRHFETTILNIISPDGNQLARADVPVQWDPCGEFGIARHTFMVTSPELWEPTSPSLYRLEAQTQHECCETTFGFRSILAREGKLILNGKPLLLKGVSRHQEDRVTGLAQSVGSARQDLDAIRGLNGNFVRLSHYPHSAETLELCDELGLCAWVEIPLYQSGLGIIRFLFDKTKRSQGKTWRSLPSIFKATRALEDHVLLLRARDDLLKMIERDGNHPSILFWGLGNECWSLHPSGAKALTWLRAQAEDFDSSRLFSYAAFALPYFGVRYERAYHAVDVVGLNEYFGWYYGKVADAAPYLQALARKYPHKPLLVTETGADAVRGRHTDQIPPERGYSEEYQAWLLETQWRQMRAVPTFAGLSVWVLKDFLCPEYREDNPVPFYNLKGLLDRDGQPKLSYERMKTLYREDQKID